MDPRCADQVFMQSPTLTAWPVMPAVARVATAPGREIVVPKRPRVQCPDTSPVRVHQPIAAKPGGVVRRWLARAWLVSGVLLSALLLGGWLPGTPQPTGAPTAVAAVVEPARRTPPALPAVAPQTKRIEQLRVGDRVRTPRPADPALEGTDPFPTGPTGSRIDQEDVTPEGWRTLELRVEQPDGSTTRIEMLRPVWWLEEVGVHEGGTIELALLELEIQATAKVVRMGPCLADSRRNRAGEEIVTATFVHEGAEVWDLIFEGGVTLGVTRRHPLFSQDRQDWVAAGDIRVGERVLSACGASTLTGKAFRPERETVYNLEVHRTHAYYVGHSGLLAHNNPGCGFGKPETPAAPNSPTSGPRGPTSRPLRQGLLFPNAEEPPPNAGPPRQGLLFPDMEDPAPSKGAKPGPVPRNQGGPHNEKILSEAEKLKAEGNQIVSGGGGKERVIPTPGGKKSGRRPDIEYRTPQGETRGRNVGRTKADGSPVPREVDAIDDLQGPGKLPMDRFVPYDR
jgi:hypothetical protein